MRTKVEDIKCDIATLALEEQAWLEAAERHRFNLAVAENVISKLKRTRERLEGLADLHQFLPDFEQMAEREVLESNDMPF